VALSSVVGPDSAFAPAVLRRYDSGMNVVRGLFVPLPELRTPVVTLGAFDGVHRGHQRILAETTAWARELGGHSAVVTFDPLPKAVVGGAGALCITSLPHRLALMGELGLDLAVVIPFDAAVAGMPAEQFVRRVLLGWLGARHVVFGHDSTFGRGGEGNLALLRRMEAEGALGVRSPAPVRYRGKVISSTAIRQAIRAGELRAAAAMLGRPFSLLGTVVRGEGRGRTLGFPTANLDLHHEAIPPEGVYATFARLLPAGPGADTGETPVPPPREDGRAGSQPAGHEGGGTGLRPVGHEGGGTGLRPVGHEAGGTGLRPVGHEAGGTGLRPVGHEGGGTGLRPVGHEGGGTGLRPVDTWPSLTYVGRRPTFAPDDAPTCVEVYLIGSEADLYGCDMEVRFVKFLRGDLRFPSPEALVAQMEADKKAALRLCRRER